MKISVVILTCNQSALTMRCLSSLALMSAPGADSEVILVDNGSTDGTSDEVARQFPGVRIIRLPENVGVARGRNAGLAAAHGEHLMILDNDTIASPDTIAALSAYLDTHSGVGLVAPLLRNPEGRVQASFKSYPGLGVKLRNVMRSKEVTSFATDIPADDFEPFYVIGAAQMFTREVYEEVGGLDPTIFFGPEDADFCMAVRKSGRRVVCLPRLSIVHDWQRATTRRLLSRAALLHARALVHFWLKHRRIF